MAWAKAKTILVATLAVATAGVTRVAYQNADRAGAGQRQTLADGSLLELTRARVATRVEIVHGTAAQKLLGDLIPAKGIRWSWLNLSRPTKRTYSLDQSELFAEFKLTGPNAAKNPLNDQAQFFQFRYVVVGERGIEHVQQVSTFEAYPEGYFGFLIMSHFPRDSRWLGFYVERRADKVAGGPWEKVAEFKIANPSAAAIQPWAATPVPITNSARGLELISREITVAPIPYSPRTIAKHLVTAPMEVRSNEVWLTNWSAAYARAEDASGNYDQLWECSGLDPRFVWKLEVDFEPKSQFAEENVATIRLPAPSSSVTVAAMKVPVTISWDDRWILASIPTNQPDLALRYIGAADDEGQRAHEPSGSWSQFRFNRGSFMTLRDGKLTTDFKPTEVTVAIVPNVHTTFYTQPRWVSEPGK